MTTLIVIRGNSGAGKSTVARAVRSRFGRGCALVEQDYLRRILLREHEQTGAAGLAPRLIASVVEMALDGGYHVVLEGILAVDRYGEMLRGLISAHPGESHVYYLDVSWAESLRRHETRPQDFTPAQMHDWFLARDLLDVPGELLVPESSTLDETVATIMHTSSLAAAAAVAPCPASCTVCSGRGARTTLHG